MNKQVCDGFTLLEVLIYILFFAFIAMATASWMVRLWQSSCARNSKQEALITMYSAHDMFLRDIQHAPADRKQWKEILPECLIWHMKAGDVGWQWEQEQLVRREGHYHHKKKEWHKQTKNLIVDHVDKVRFACVGEQEIVHISFAIIAGSTSVEGVAAPLCRRLPWREEVKGVEAS